MLGEDIDFFKRVAVDQAADPFARGQLALGGLAIECVGVAVACLVLALAQLIEGADLVVLGIRPHSLSMNIQRCPSRSSTLYLLPSVPSSSSERMVAPASLAPSK